MPVADRESSDIVRRASDAPYGCKDRVMSPGYWTLQRFYFPDGRYVMHEVFIKHTMSTDCRYDKSLLDPRCGECGLRGTGEEYAAAVLAAAG